VGVELFTPDPKENDENINDEPETELTLMDGLDDEPAEVTLADFYQVNMVYDEGTKKEKTVTFPCQLLSVSRKREIKPLQCSFLRKKGEYFVFPPVEDFYFIGFYQIVRKLKVKSQKRGKYFFFLIYKTFVIHCSDF